MKLTIQHKSLLTGIVEWFTSHPESHGMTYLQHLKFACGIATRFIITGTVFGLHGIIPEFPIAKSLDFEATIHYLDCKNKKVAQKPEVDIFEVTSSS